MSTRDSILELQRLMGRSIIGQETVVQRLLLTLLCNGNLLLEGLPGLAKTRAIKSLSRRVRKRMDERRKEYEQSEAAAFDSMQTAARKGDTVSFIRYLYRWIDRIPPIDRISTLGSISGRDRELDGQLASLLGDRYSRRKTDGTGLEEAAVRSLSRVRGEIAKKEGGSRRSENRLPLLNP